MTTVTQILQLLDLKPLPVEGGYFRETFQSEEQFSAGRYSGSRNYYSAIYYLITPQSWSALHQLCTDELYHFYLGDPVELLQLHPDGKGEVTLLGNQLERGARPQVRVPAFTWQGAKLAEGGNFALLGTTMAPGYHPDDFTIADPVALKKAFPAWREKIDAYDRQSHSF